MTKIIAFAGRKQSGKTTSSELIKRYFSEVLECDDVKIYNFADPLKQICMDILGLTHDQCYGDDIHKNELTDLCWEDKQLTAREVMQFLGTDIFRKMKNNVWTDAILSRIKTEQPKIAIIADCRFPNEVLAVKNAGGIVIKLMLNKHNSDHSSETALDPENFNYRNFDIVIHNQNLSLDQKDYAILSFLKKKGVLKL